MSIGEQTFTIHRFQIEAKALNVPIYIIPFGDIHRFAPLCDEKKWLEFLYWARRKPNAYFLGMGDYDDLASFNERKALLTANLHESTKMSLEDLFKDRADRLSGELNFMKGKLIGLIEGNHFGELQNNTTTTQRMCEKLNCRYLGVSSFIRLAINHGDKHRAVDIWAHHGRGAARLVGGSLNTVQQMSDIAEADIYLMGHDHKKSIAIKTRLCLSEGGSGIALSHKKILLGRTGSFLKGYEPDAPSYIVRSALSPTDMGVIKIELTPHRIYHNYLDKSGKKKQQDNFYIDVHASL